MLLSALLCSLLLLPTLPPFDLSAARAAWEKGDLEDAARLVEEHLSTDEGDLEAHLLRAEIQLALADPDFVLNELDALSATGDPRVLVLLGRAYEDIGYRLQDQGAGYQDVGYFLGEALSSYEQAAALEGAGNIEGATRAGYLSLYTFNDWEAALNRANSNLARDAENGELLLLRGCARLYEYLSLTGSENGEGGDDKEAATSAWEAAIADLKLAAEQLGPERGDAHWQLAWLYEAEGHAELAVDAALAHMQRTKGMDISRTYELAKRYAAELEFKAAEKALSAMIERDQDEFRNWLSAEPNAGEVAISLGWSIGPAVSAGRLDEARDILEPLLSVQPQNALIWNNYGLLCRDTGVVAERRGKVDRADELYAASYAAYEKSLSFDPENPQIMNDTALVMQYHVKTNLDRAKELYRSAIVIAEKLVKAGKGNDEVRTALRDARNNLRLMGG